MSRRSAEKVLVIHLVAFNIKKNGNRSAFSPNLSEAVGYVQGRIVFLQLPARWSHTCSCVNTRWKRSAEECCCRRVNQTCTSLSRLLQHLRSVEEQQSLSVCFSACRWWFGLLMAVTDVRKVLSSRWHRVTESKHIQGCLRKSSLYYRTWLDKWY